MTTAAGVKMCDPETDGGVQTVKSPPSEVRGVSSPGGTCESEEEYRPCGTDSG